jgi:hypothetical protein
MFFSPEATIFLKGGLNLLGSGNFSLLFSGIAVAPTLTIFRMTPHPSRGTMTRFMRGELKRGEAQAIVRHLLTGCPQCRQRTRKLWDLGEFQPPDKYLLAEMRRRAKASRAGRVSLEEEIR